MQTNNIALDTSVLMTQGKEPSRDIFEELLKMRGRYVALVPSFVISELEGLKKAKKGQKLGKKQRAARTVLALLEQYSIEKTVAENTQTERFYKVDIVVSDKGKKTVDTALIDFAKKFRAEVCTTDKGLKQKSEEKGVEVLYLGQYPKGARKKS